MHVPKHIGIILDGNRRFAKRLALQSWKGHEYGAQKFRDLLTWCEELGVREITAYCFSTQNFNRSKQEVETIMKIFTDELKSMLLPEKIELWKKKGLRYRVIGQLELLSPELKQLCTQIMDLTKTNTPRCVNFAFAYGGREEIVHAARQIAKEVEGGMLKAKDVNEDEITKRLWLTSEPDLIIRTGGEKRLSNFLPWQSVYSELIFLEKFWPELEKEDLLACVKEYNERERRFGK